MNKRVCSIILLCLIIISFIFTVGVFVNTGISIYQLDNSEIDISNDKLPGASILGVAFVYVSLLLGLVIAGGIGSSIGFLCSLINVKISQNMIISRISKVFLCFYSIVLLLVFSIFIFLLFQFFT